MIKKFAHNLPRLEQYLLSGSFITLAVYIVLLSINYAQAPAIQYGETLGTTQIVKAWNFNTSAEGWKGYNNAQVLAGSGYLNVKLGLFPGNNNIQNREARTYLPLPLKYLTFKLAIQKEDVDYPDSIVTNSNTYFNFYVYYKKAGSDSWYGPRTLYGKVSPNFMEYTIKIPALNPLTITALKVVFKNGIAVNDTVRFDTIKVINQPQTTITPTPTYYYKPTPSVYNQPTPSAWETPVCLSCGVSPYNRPTPTRTPAPSIRVEGCGFYGGICKSSCSANEKQFYGPCNPYICCVPQSSTPASSSG